MTCPSLHYLIHPSDPSARRLAWWQWGASDAPHVVVCVHGLTRQGRDFDVLAQALLARADQQNQSLRVLCPDVAGRGHSDWLALPEQYQLPTYLADMQVLLAHVHAQSPVARLDWVGTSMGGLIGMLAAALPAEGLAAPLARLVLNDVGPRVEWDGIVQIQQRQAARRSFASLPEALAALREAARSFGQHSDAQWEALMRPMLRPVDDMGPEPGSGWRLHYDPAIDRASLAMTQDALAQTEAPMWAVYERIACPTLLLRGAQSDVLSACTAQAMTERGPRAQCVCFDNVGHAPTLVTPEQLAPILDFLLPQEVMQSSYDTEQHL